jgi:hypothetical protein
MNVSDPMNEMDRTTARDGEARTDTVASLPDRAAIMRPKRERRRNRKSRLVAAASVAALTFAVAGASLAVQAYRQQSGSERLADERAARIDDLRLRAQLAVLADLEATRADGTTPTGTIPTQHEPPSRERPAVGSPEPAPAPSQSVAERPSQPSDGTPRAVQAAAADDPILSPPDAPAPVAIVELPAASTPPQVRAAVETLPVEVPLPEQPAPLLAEAFAAPDPIPLPPERPKDIVEQVASTAVEPTAVASAPPLPAQPAPNAVATGRVIAQTETPLPPRRPRDLPVTTTQRTTTAAIAPNAQAERTATRRVDTRTRVFVHYSSLDPDGRSRAEQVARRLAAQGFEVADLRSRGVEIMTSNVRYYHPQDRSASSVVRDIVDASFPDLGLNATRLRDFAGFPAPPSQGVVELWLSSWSEPTWTPLR